MPIKSIIIYKDDLFLQMKFICSHCKKEHIHCINHAKKEDKKTIEINFSKLGKRCCDNFHHKHFCLEDYDLYKLPSGTDC